MLLASHLRSIKASLGIIQWHRDEETYHFCLDEMMISMHWALRLRQDCAESLRAAGQQTKQRIDDSHCLILRNFGDLEGWVQMVLDKCCEYTTSPKLGDGCTEATGHGASFSSGGQSWYLTRMPGP